VKVATSPPIFIPFSTTKDSHVVFTPVTYSYNDQTLLIGVIIYAQTMLLIRQILHRRSFYDTFILESVLEWIIGVMLNFVSIQCDIFYECLDRFIVAVNKGSIQIFFATLIKTLNKLQKFFYVRCVACAMISSDDTPSLTEHGMPTM